MNNVLLGVSGGIAAYKAVDLARRLVQRGFQVKVVMSENATRLVGPATFRAVTSNPVALSLFAEGGAPMEHISLAREADVVVVAPATANIIAKMAHGLADDLLSTTLLATRAPVLVAPAMNREMWSHPATIHNLEILKERGVVVVGPESGPLACGEEGEGRMSDPEAIAEAVLHVLGMGSLLSGVQVLVTAGGTREPIDPVRFIGNRSSGKMGYALAATAARMGAKVCLVSGPSALACPGGVDRVLVETAEEMRREVVSRAPSSRVVVMAAAVADFMPAEAVGEKIKRAGRDKLTLELVRTPDILAELGATKKDEQVLVGFAAETGDLVEKARAKMREKKVDMMVANDVSSPGSGFDSDYNRALLLFAGGREVQLDLMPKTDLAARIWEEVSSLLEGKAGR
ncbi:MAG: bifunctional phosphopantothenoylcysteine decarboxylase/phosphopantothenate--cysteine ligase CoaBC [Actinobacteria bacterium]|nr:bifunctional phosphopantothenoylcysteine decarboxylase/phosphopantothenate--cysteine ligase CoaBC [Actinomycetota bacterium]